MGWTDQDIVFWQYALNASWVLLPLVPAIVIYLIFPKTEAGLSGPLYGLSVRASGAFAAYFLILLATFPLLNRQNRNLEGLLNPVWEISGKIRVEDENGREIAYGEDGGPLVIRLDPDPVHPGGPTSQSFDITVPEIGDKIPRLNLDYTGYDNISVDPQDPPDGIDVDIDPDNHKINISQITIRKTAPCEGICGEQ